MACRVTGDQEHGIQSIELVSRAGTDTGALKDAAVRELSDGFAVDIEPSAVAVSALPAAPTSAREGGAALEAAAPPEEALLGAATVVTPNGRARIQNVALYAHDSRAEARVSLEYAGRTWSGVSQGPNTSHRRYRLIAEATLSGLEQILDEPGLFSIEDLRLVELADGPVVVVALELTSRRAGQRLSGSCSASSAHGSIEEATVRATLQSVNRLFGLFARDGGPSDPRPS